MKGFAFVTDQSFDIPDRTFHSMNTTWRLSSFESMTDVKELIPEFFYLPEFLVNREGGRFSPFYFLTHEIGWLCLSIMMRFIVMPYKINEKCITGRN